MKLFDIFIDKASSIIYLKYNFKNVESYMITVGDIHNDVIYYKYSATVGESSLLWIYPLAHRLMDLVKNNKNFAGFCVKVYTLDRRLLQVENLVINEGAKKIVDNFYVDQFDVNGASYIDFFYGDLCKDLNVSGTVVDAGANFGFFTLFSRQNGANRIYSIEPDPLPFFYLGKNFRSCSDVILLNKAMGVDDAGMTFNICIDNSVASSEFLNIEKMHSMAIPTISVDTLLKIEPIINLLKLDIEGTEVKLIEQFNKTHFERINQLFIEFHGPPISIFNKLVELGYKTKYVNSTANDLAGFIYATK